MPETAAHEPTCCGEPMIHNSFTSEYECSAAYFTLVDDLGDGPDEPFEGIVALLEPDDVPADLRPVLAHWRESCTWDGDPFAPGAPATNPKD